MGAGDKAGAAAREAQRSLAHNLLFMDQVWEDCDSRKVLDIFHTTLLFKASPPFVINRVIIIGHDGKVPCPD